MRFLTAESIVHYFGCFFFVSAFKMTMQKMLVVSVFESDRQVRLCLSWSARHGALVGSVEEHHRPTLLSRESSRQSPFEWVFRVPSCAERYQSDESGE